MARTGKTGYRFIIWAMGRLGLLKIARLLNRLLVSSLGVRVVPANRLDEDWLDRLLYFQRLFDLLGGGGR